MNPAEPVVTAAPARVAAFRVRAWPGDERVGVVLPTDHHAVPTRRDVERVVAAARADGYRALRTGALFPRAAVVFADVGFATIDTLALLDLDLRGTSLPAAPTSVRVAPLRRWQHEAAARVDRRAFGPLWGNDASTLRDIRAATPVHHARRIDEDGSVVAIAISGAAGRTGYLQRLAVDPAQQRRGYASALVADAITWMRRRGLTDAVVNTGVDNVPALALYERFGFRRRDEHLVIGELVLVDAPA